MPKKKPVKIEGRRKPMNHCPIHGAELVQTESYQTEFKTKRYCPGKLNWVNDEDGPHEVPDEQEYEKREKTLQEDREDIFEIEDMEIIE